MLKHALIFALLLGPGVTGVKAQEARQSLPELPPLTEPATNTHLPGKFVWADYFTSDIDVARRFYGELFDWEWRWVVNEPGSRYGIFYSEGEPVAGVAEWEAPDPDRTYGRWIHYISVDDVGESVAAVKAKGGTVLLDRRNYAERGSFAVVADAGGVLFGVIKSSSGDPEDYRAETGEWIWINLYARNTQVAADFYAALFDYDTYAPEEEEVASEVLDIYLARHGYSRAGVRRLSDTSESQPTWLGYVRVDDVQAVVARARALGGEVLFSPDENVASGDLAVVADPVGATIGVLFWVFEEEEGE